MQNVIPRMSVNVEEKADSRQGGTEEIGSISDGARLEKMRNEVDETSVSEKFYEVDYDYEEIWDFVPNVDGHESKVPAHTMEMKSKHVKKLLALPHVMPTPSADENAVLGKTPGWPEGEKFEYDDKTFDPADQSFAPGIPPQNIYGFMITNPVGGDRDEKAKVVLTAGNHPHEHMGDWVLEGMVNFLVSGDFRAEALREKVVFYVYPCVNPDGAILHLHDLYPRTEKYPYNKYAGNPELYAKGVSNHNRLWGTEGEYATIDILQRAMKNDTGGKADYAWDFHGGPPHNPGDWRATEEDGWNTDFAKALKARQLPSCKPKIHGAKEGNFRHWVVAGLGVAGSFVHEPYKDYDREDTAEAGRIIALAFYDVYV